MSEDCKHKLVVPNFDKEKASKMTEDEVRKIYPRFSGVCPECGHNVIVYASPEHFFAGDW